VHSITHPLLGASSAYWIALSAGENTSVGWFAPLAPLVFTPYAHTDTKNGAWALGDSSGAAFRVSGEAGDAPVPNQQHSCFWASAHRGVQPWTCSASPRIRHVV
jgi:hypothetical protein